MAFTVTFPTVLASPASNALGERLVALGEPFESEGAQGLVLRALRLRLVLDPTGPMRAHVEVERDTPLVRLIDVLFEVSSLAGADVHLAGSGAMTRARLWLRFADEQDRIRLVGALGAAVTHSWGAEAARGMWAILAEAHRGRDVRWDSPSGRIVEMVEVGVGISLEEAEWIVDEPKPGDLVPRPLAGQPHVLAWRWLSEAYPGLCES